MSFLGRCNHFSSQLCYQSLPGCHVSFLESTKALKDDRVRRESWFFKAPTKEGFTLGIRRIHPAHKKNHDQRFFTWNVFFFFWVLVVEDSDFYTFARVLVKSWTWERNWSRGAPEKKGYNGRSGKKKWRHGKEWSFLNFFFHPLFFKDVFFFCAFLLEVLVDGLVGWFFWKSLDENFTTMGFLIPKESEKNHVALVNRALAFVL